MSIETRPTKGEPKPQLVSQCGGEADRIGLGETIGPHIGIERNTEYLVGTQLKYVPLWIPHPIRCRGLSILTTSQIVTGAPNKQRQRSGIAVRAAWLRVLNGFPAALVDVVWLERNAYEISAQAVHTSARF